MGDNLTARQRNKCMSNVKGKDTVPEIKLRKNLWAKGFRYSLKSKLPGKPDIVLPKYKAVIFVHGCFWHQHEGCRKSTRPETRKEFWDAKLDANVERDKRNMEKLMALGWRVAVVWECAVKKKSSFEETIATLENWIRSEEVEIIISKCKIE